MAAQEDDLYGGGGDDQLDGGDGIISVLEVAPDLIYGEKETIEFLLLAAMQQYMVVMVMTLSTPVNPVIQLISRGLFGLWWRRE